ncbi:MAG TPA: hypothetical protein VHL11_01855 [Phototrophicaceae bacterium]|jgi:hypothetical protein|nr:hypothetical protein [Phototrophicaceae bacterium]
MLIAICAIGEALRPAGQNEKALEYFTFVLQHPLSHQFIRAASNNEIVWIRENLSPDVFAASEARGKTLTLDQVVAELLAAP